MERSEATEKKLPTLIHTKMSDRSTHGRVCMRITYISIY